MKMKYALSCLIAALLATPTLAVDLFKQYPTQLVKGDAKPENARAWEFKTEDVFRVSHFALEVGSAFKVEMGAADLGIGHCADGAVWAVLLPREPGALTSSVSQKAEAVAHIWLRFHPAQINRLFSPSAVSAEGNADLVSAMRAIAERKMNSSWQAGGKAMIPEPKDLTVYVDTKEGAHRFFVVNTQARTAEYIAAFNSSSDSMPMTAESAPPVIIKTVPEAGSKNVPPGEYEIKVTFSKEMTDQSWSWSTAWQHSDPESLGKPHYEADHKTCVMKVKLEPGKTYGWWLNSQKFHGFKDAQGQAAVPYLLTFQTAAKTTADIPTIQKMLATIPSANELPGTLTFHGHYKHRSRGADIEQPSELWLKETPDGGVTALAQLPFSNATELADGKQHRIAQSAAGNQPAYQIDLELGNEQARLNRRGVREDCDGKELKVPAGAWFDPNTRPDSYCAANVLLRAFAVGENETKEFRAYDWDNTGNALVDYTIRVKHAGKERVEVPAGSFEANHLVLTQLTSANTWFKKSAGHVTDFWVLDNQVIVRILRHREPYELVLLDYDVPAKLPGLDQAGTLK